MATSRVRDAGSLIERVRKVGQRLIAAQPREMAVGNIVRRVLGLIREVVEEGADSEAGPASPQPGHDSLNSHLSNLNSLNQGSSIPQYMSLGVEGSGRSSPGELSDSGSSGHARPPLLTSHTSYASAGPQVTSLFGLLSHPDEASPIPTPPAGTQSPMPKLAAAARSGLASPPTEPKVDIKAEVIDGIKELLDELEVVDDQIAASALEHIHANEIILTHTSSTTVQKFLISAARKRKFTVVHAEAFPNDHTDTHATIMTGGKKGDDDEDADDRWKTLTSMGITVIVIPDSAVFALMSRVNKVILAPHTVLANGGLIAAAGALTIAQAAKVHQTPVVVVSGVYKLSPVYPFDMEELVEYGDPGKVIGFDEGDVVENVEVVNPIYDYVGADLVDLYITNL